MPRIEESIKISQPVNKVFTYTTDPNSWPKWQPFPAVEKTSPGPMGIGSTTKGTIRMMGLTMKWTAEVTEYELNSKFGKNIKSGPINIRERNTYDAQGESTKIAIVYDITLGAIMKPLSPVFVSSMRKTLEKALQDLKDNLEASAS
jgi:ligand-binding SRPBCC domain-containing protein